MMKLLAGRGNSIAGGVPENENVDEELGRRISRRGAK